MDKENLQQKAVPDSWEEELVQDTPKISNNENKDTFSDIKKEHTEPLKALENILTDETENEIKPPQDALQNCKLHEDAVGRYENGDEIDQKEARKSKRERKKAQEELKKAREEERKARKQREEARKEAKTQVDSGDEAEGASASTVTEIEETKTKIREPRELEESKLYIRNLEEQIDDNGLKEMFQQFGSIISTNVVRDRETGKSKCFGFVNFETPEEANTAMTEMNRKKIGKKKITITFAEKKAEKPKTIWAMKKPERKLFVPLEGPTVLKETELYINNLDDSVDNAQLIERFKHFGTIREARVARDKMDKSKGFAFLCFDTHEEAKRAMSQMNGQIIGEKEITISLVEVKPGARGQNPRVADKIYRRDKIIVRNLEETVDDEELKSVFIQFGNIIEARVLLTEEGASRHIGFVQYFSSKAAEKAIVEMNGRVIKGNYTFVYPAEHQPGLAKAKPKSNPKGIQKETVCVANFPKGTNKGTIQNLFSRFGSIVHVNMVAAQRVAFVNFVLAKDAQQAVHQMNGHVLNSKPLKVALASHGPGPSHDPFYMPKKPSQDPFYLPPPVRKNKKGDLSIF